MGITFVLNTMGWIFLICGWVIPQFIKKETDKSLVGLVLSALSLGFCTSALVVAIMS